VDNVHTFRLRLSRRSCLLVRISHVLANSLCCQGLEDSSSPTSGTVFSQVKRFLARLVLTKLDFLVFQGRSDDALLEAVQVGRSKWPPIFWNFGLTCELLAAPSIPLAGVSVTSKGSCAHQTCPSVIWASGWPQSALNRSGTTPTVSASLGSETKPSFWATSTSTSVVMVSQTALATVATAAR
jgi:hypothetical protein